MDNLLSPNFIFPPIFKHTRSILKNVGFSTCYLFCLSLFSYYILKKKEMSFTITLVALVILFYGTAVKYQAIFLLPFMSCWLGFIKNGFRMTQKTFFYSVLIYIGMYSSVTVFNNYVVQQKDHAWQYVKLYDLAAISLATEKNLFPEFNLTPSFTFKKIKEKYNCWSVDELVFGSDAILQKGRTSLERDQLWISWFHAVIDHPVIYFKHRLSLSKNLWTLSAIKNLKDIKTDHSYILYQALFINS